MQVEESQKLLQQVKVLEKRRDRMIAASQNREDHRLLVCDICGGFQVLFEVETIEAAGCDFFQVLCLCALHTHGSNPGVQDPRAECHRIACRTWHSETPPGENQNLFARLTL